MRNLVYLELKKFSLRPHLIGLGMANIIILLVSIFTSTFFTSGTNTSVAGLPPMQLDTVTMAALLVNATLIVWESVLISTFIIEEYRNKTIALLFTYPVNRAKLILTKVIMICGIIFVFHICSMVFQNICISFLRRQFDFVTYSFENPFVQVITTVSTILLGLFPMFVGMVKKSTITTVVSSLIIVAVASNSQGATAGLLSIPLLAITFGMIGAIFGAVAIKKMITSDLYN